MLLLSMSWWLSETSLHVVSPVALQCYDIPRAVNYREYAVRQKFVGQGDETILHVHNLLTVSREICACPKQPQHPQILVDVNYKRLRHQCSNKVSNLHIIMAHCWARHATRVLPKTQKLSRN